MALLFGVAVAGIACGAGCGTSIACLGDTEKTEVNFALSWGVQCAAAIFVSYLLPRLMTPDTALTFVLVFLAIFALLGLPFIVLFPQRGKKGASILRHPQ